MGRLSAVHHGVLLISGGLRNVCVLADLKMKRLLAKFDEWAGLGPEADGDLLPTRVPAAVWW